ncbi:MAG: dihydrodipicolinate synthase family protein [Alphaproteobacteria bacterium]
MVASRTGFRGVYPVLYAYFTADGIDRAAMVRQTEAVVRAGVHGIAVLGLATEVNKLSLAERHTVLETVAEALGGRRPLAVTIAENTVPGQIDFVRAAERAGAAWLILQPPPVKDVPERELIRFFGAVADAASIPVAIQNAPRYLGIGLSAAGLAALQRQHSNLALVKVEDAPGDIAALIEATGGAIDVFVGRAGIEQPDALRAGAVGIIPAPEACDRLARSYDLMESDPAASEAVYREALPTLAFLETSINHLVSAGKEIVAARLGLGPVVHRLPAELSPTVRASIARHAAALGPL